MMVGVNSSKDGLGPTRFMLTIKAIAALCRIDLSGP